MPVLNCVWCTEMPLHNGNPSEVECIWAVVSGQCCCWERKCSDEFSVSSQWSHRWLDLALAILLPPQPTEEGCLQAATSPAEETMAMTEKWLASLTEALVRRLHLQTLLDSFCLRQLWRQSSVKWFSIAISYFISLLHFSFCFVRAAIVMGTDTSEK